MREVHRRLLTTPFDAVPESQKEEWAKRAREVWDALAKHARETETGREIVRGENPATMPVCAFRCTQPDACTTVSSNIAVNATSGGGEVCESAQAQCNGPKSWPHFQCAHFW